MIRIDDFKDVELSNSIGNSLFQISHVLLFTSIYLSNRIEKFNRLLLIPIIVQLIDLIPIELLHSLKFSLISTLSIIIGWITILKHSYENNQKRDAGLILIAIICLIFSSILGTITITTTSLSNPTGDVYKFGMKMFSFDNFNLIGETVSFHQSFWYFSLRERLIFLTMKEENKYAIQEYLFFAGIGYFIFFGISEYFNIFQDFLKWITLGLFASAALVSTGYGLTKIFKVY